MRPGYQEIPMLFDKGLTTAPEASVLQDGQLADLENLLPEPEGGLRVRGSWKIGSKTGITGYAPYQHRGFGILSEQTLPDMVNEWEDINNVTSSLTTLTVTASGVTAGNTLILVVDGIRQFTSSLTLTINSVPTGFSLMGVKQEPSPRSEIYFYSKTADGSEGVLNVSATPSATALLTMRVMEWENLSLTSITQNSSSGVTPQNATNGSQNTEYGINFFVVQAEPDTASPDPTDTTITQIGSTSVDTGDTCSTLWQQVYSASSAVTEEFTATGGSTLYWSVNAIDAINADQFNQNLVVAIPANDIEAENDLLDFSNITTFGSTSNATTYTVGTGVTPAINSLAIVTVVTRKIGSTGDVVSSVTGTNGWNVTYTSQLTSTTGEYRMTTLTGPIDSASAGNIVVNFGVGNTQDAIRCNVTLVSPDGSQTRVTDLSVIANPVVAIDDNTGTGTSVAVTFPSALTPNSGGHFGLFAATTTSSELNVVAPWTELADNAIADAILLATAAASDPADATFTLDASYSWLYHIMEIETGTADTGYTLFKIPIDEIDSGDWEVLDEEPEQVENSSKVRMKEGAGSFVYTGTGMRSPRSYTKSTQTWANVSDLAEGARALEYHKNRFFYGGTLTNPGRLYFSDLGAPESVPVSNFIDIDPDDGAAIEDLVSVENLLLVVKTNSLWIISGSGISSFIVSELAGGGGAPGEPAVSTPYGTVVADQYTVWSVQGGGVDPISRPLQGDYSISGLVSTAYAFDKVYISDSLTRDVWVCNLLTGSWHKETVAATDEGVHSIHSFNDQLFYGTQNSSTCGPLAYRVAGAPERQPDETAATTTYNWTGPITFLNGPQFKYTPRWLFAQVRRHGTGPDMTITVRAGGQGAPVTRNFTIATGETLTRERLDVGFAQGMAWLQVEATQTVDFDEQAFEIEKLTMGADVEFIR